MPIYTYECEPCDVITNEHRSVADRYDSPPCRKCGMETKFKITGTHVAPVTGAGSGTGASGLTKRFIASQQ